MNAKRRDAFISQKTRTLVKKFGRLFPDRPFEVAYAWAGTFAETKDGLAYIGVHPRFPHAYFALGYGGNGITFAVIAGEIIRDYFLSRTNRDSHQWWRRKSTRLSARLTRRTNRAICVWFAACGNGV